MDIGTVAFQLDMEGKCMCVFHGKLKLGDVSVLNAFHVVEAKRCGNEGM